jgi:hypothetical protein
MRSLVLALVLAGCSQPAPSDFLDVLPDERIQVNLPVGGDRGEREWSTYYLFAATVTQSVNALIGGVLVWVDVITDTPPSWSSTEENTAVWGPYAQALDPAETILWVHYEAEDDTYQWGFSQRPKGETSDEAWVPVIAGHVDAGATHEASSGWFVIDFDAAASLDPRVTARGAFGTEYALAPEGVSATAGFDAFADGGDTLDAYYHYEQATGGSGKMDLGLLTDATGNATPEEVLLRSRWEATGEGRGDGYVTGGDLGELVATASECWDTSFQAVFHDDSWSEPTGDPALCVYAEPEYVPEDEGL